MPTLRSKKEGGGPRTLEGPGEPTTTATGRHADPGEFPESQQSQTAAGARPVKRRVTWKPRRRASTGERPNAAQKADGCLTDPEPGMDSRRATVRNMRSKCRCSCVLQFTFRRAVSCVLHRPPSQVIHCIVLFLSYSLCQAKLQIVKQQFNSFSHLFTRKKGSKN